MGIKVFITSKSDIFREGLQKILENSSEIQVVGFCTSVQDFQGKIVNSKPHIVIIDTTTPDLDCVKAVKVINNLGLRTYVIFLTDSLDTSKKLFLELKIDARGYIERDVETERLIRGIQNVYSGGMVVSPLLASELFQLVTFSDSKQPVGYSNLQHGFTKRESEVFDLVAKGLSNKDIADTLSISCNTVKSHVESVFHKLSVHNRRQALLLIQENNRNPIP
jgi:DNA-binding NarL/FixJ family response regulator